MNAKVLISTSEYKRLKQQQEQQRQRQQEDRGKEEGQQQFQQQTYELGTYTQIPTRRGNMVERTILEPEHKKQNRDSQTISQESSYDDRPHLKANFLPAEKSVEVRQFLENLLIHPDTNIEEGILNLQGKPIGHIVLVLHALFGHRKDMESNMVLFKRFLRDNHVLEHSSKTESKKKTTEMDDKVKKRRMTKKTVLVKENRKKSNMKEDKTGKKKILLLKSLKLD